MTKRVRFDDGEATVNEMGLECDLQTKERKGKVQDILDESESESESEGEQPAQTADAIEFQEEAGAITQEGGFKIEPFNMTAELEDGDFDQEGQYVRKVDDGAEHDGWMKGISDQEILVASTARSRQLARDEAAAEQPLDINQTYIRLLSMMKPREVGGGIKKRVLKKSLVDPKQAEIDKEQRKNVETFTGYCDALLKLGDTETYENTYEQIVRKLRIAEVLEDDWQIGDALPVLGAERAQDAMFEYKWTAESVEVFGPYPKSTIVEWIDSKHFTLETLVRKITPSASLNPSRGFVKIGSLGEF